MIIESELTSKAYRKAMRKQLSSPWDFGMERFTGILMGPVFSVVHHAGYEWNRRFTNEKNSAVGFVKKTEEGCEVHFIRLKGFLHPQAFLKLLLLFCIPCFIEFQMHGQLELWRYLLIALGCTLLAAVVAAMGTAVTQRGQEGERSLMVLLEHPELFYGYPDEDEDE